MQIYHQIFQRFHPDSLGLHDEKLSLPCSLSSIHTFFPPPTAEPSASASFLPNVPFELSTWEQGNMARGASGHQALFLRIRS